jgi:hypothetical protein
MDILIVYSPKVSFVANGSNPIGVGLALGETICFGSLEFTTDHLGGLSLSPQEGDPGALFMGMVHSGSPSLHTAIKDSFDEGGTTSGEGGSSGSPNPRGCNMVTPECPHHHHTGAKEHSDAPDHPDGHGVDCHATARYVAPP